MSDVLVLYPRAMVAINALTAHGDEKSTPIVPAHLVIKYSPRQHAHTCELKVDLSVLPFDPRQIEGLYIQAFMGRVPKAIDSVLDEKYLRFTGYSDELEVKRGPDGFVAEIRARDVSQLLREHKPLEYAATPRYQDTLRQAIQRILEQCGLNKNGQNHIEIVDEANGQLDLPLSKISTKRGSVGLIPMEQTITAWEAIEKVCTLAALIPLIELQKLVVRTPQDVFRLEGESSNKKAYEFVFGTDQGTVLNVDLKKKFHWNVKGVRIIADNGKDKLVSDFPADSKIPPRKRPNMTSSKKNSSSKNKKPPEPRPRDIFYLGQLGLYGVQTQDQLDKIAELVYRERAHQDVEGELKTAIWDSDNKIFDLRHGDDIRIKINPVLDAELKKAKSEQFAIDFLKSRLGMNESAARVLLTNTENDIFHARTITHEWSPKGARTSVDFISLYVVDAIKLT